MSEKAAPPDEQQVQIYLSVTPKDLDFILSALSYAHWNDRTLTEDERNYVDSLYQCLEHSFRGHFAK